MEIHPFLLIPLLVLLAYLGFKILTGLIKTLALLFLLILVVLVIFQIEPLRSAPIVRKLIPSLPSSPFKFLEIVRNFLWKLEIESVERDSEGNLLINVKNSGKLTLSNFSVFVDGELVKIKNRPKDPLKPGEETVIQVEWSGEFSQILVKCEETTAKLEKV